MTRVLCLWVNSNRIIIILFYCSVRIVCGNHLNFYHFLLCVCGAPLSIDNCDESSVATKHDEWLDYVSSNIIQNRHRSEVVKRCISATKRNLKRNEKKLQKSESSKSLREVFDSHNVHAIRNKSSSSSRHAAIPIEFTVENFLQFVWIAATEGKYQENVSKFNDAYATLIQNYSIPFRMRTRTQSWSEWEYETKWHEIAHE